MTVGETLKRARKKLNLELDDVAESTKIAKMFLIALENDDIEVLPRGVYAKNFLRAYARYLKLDEDIITSEFHQQFSVTPHFVAQQEQTKRDDAQFRRQRLRMQLVVLVILIVVAAAGYYLWQAYQKGQFNNFGFTPSIESDDGGNSGAAAPPTSLPESPATVQNEDIQEPVVQPPDPNESQEDDELSPNEDGDQSTGEDGDASSDTTEGESLTDAVLPLQNLTGVALLPEGATADQLDQIFALRALENVWVSVTIDGDVVTSRELPAGWSRVYRYGTTHTLSIGDTSKIAIQNGADYREQADPRNFTVMIRDFGANQIFQALDNRIQEIIDQNRQENGDNE